MQITAEMVKALREKTGAGVMNCKKVLTEADGDMKKAEEALKQKGLAIAEKKAVRLVSAGLIDAYVHTGGRIAVLVEVNCETDFVARTPEFQELAHNLCLQIAAMNPKFVSEEAVPAGTEFKAESDCLLSQMYVKDSAKTIQDLVTETIAKVGENIKVARFVRLELGG